MTIDYSVIPSPCFVLDESRLRANLEIINRVQQEAGVEVILAFKGFSFWKALPIVREYVSAATASSLNEARLCYEEMQTKAHTYCVAYHPDEFEEIQSKSSHLVFNSVAQYDRFKDQITSGASCGLRVNPEWSDVETDLYNPASPTSRLGITASEFPHELPEGIEGLHFHVLCESGSHSLEQVLQSFEEKFGEHLAKVKWVNMGGGHLMTRDDYDLDHLIGVLKGFKEKNNVKVILEPGAAFAWRTGELVTSVLDIVENGGVKTAILNSSFKCHMPDTLEMPYRPNIIGASSENNGSPNKYRLGGVSCLAGDFLEEYYFDEALKEGDWVVFLDMMHYTMVQTTFFNGVRHPDIGILRPEGFELLRTFEYSDFKSKLS